MAKTARQICEFALRKIFGVDETPSASNAADALERLNDMLALWAVTGANVGETLPLSLNDVLASPAAYIRGIENNLIIEVSDLYDLPVTASVALAAKQGLQFIKMDKLPDCRVPANDCCTPVTVPPTPVPPPVISAFSMNFSVPANSGYLAALDI